MLPIRPRAQFSLPAPLRDRLVVAARQPLSDRPANQHGRGGRGYGAMVLMGLVGAIAVQTEMLHQLELNPPSIEVVDLLDGQKHLLSEVDDAIGTLADSNVSLRSGWLRAWRSSPRRALNNGDRG